ncbi:MAG: tRNA (N(6)-L-threonylcarbamoyladenosine(37)-C(2))-methylthiotransferase MtaB [Prevotellaceae bacterium]|jgi:threonylcarbamoyladenosine tRNA methylthiotransferase MtaB|nr:tRNA (N(6)-L-threonylcarbamoyladenosine(37)-C(2))-methylthiotransferase MtaB [Prevotellaceae bacterium]
MTDCTVKRVAFICLGCKLNFSESSTWAREFVSRGYERVHEREPADLYVVNTCTVTEQADKKCRQTIRRLHNMAPKAQIIVTGCYAQLKAEEIFTMEGVELVVGTEKKSELVTLADRLFTENRGGWYCQPIEETASIFPAYSSGDRTRSFLKVQDGCDYHCTYCTVPLARGISRNVSILQATESARILAKQGVKEVVLTGVNTGDFGKTTGESFLNLLKNLATIEEIRRWRISSIEPNLLTSEIIDWISKAPCFLPHFHLPLQSGSDFILTRMGRRYRRELFADVVRQIRSLMPFAFIGIDVIAGFPGEDQVAFEETFDFLEQLSPSFLHVFPFSRRPNTPAATFPHQVPEKEKRQRVERLMKLSDRLYADFYRLNMGRLEEVLFEAKERGGLMSGFTRNYIRVEKPFQKNLIGEIVDVII